ncbi:uncharacterized protein LOC114748277 [Neltuma alba]|uniref:uncharacterized protein LOC114748277 n=1 Tax=Neltuma alba TaxID=207710 RepID=UPI0010A424AF|nr:uncharacterized protein LOC114748277 [Prosopis alba]
MLVLILVWAVEFTLEFNVETSTRGNYRDFIQKLRVRLEVRSSHNRPALAIQQNPPTRFFDLVLRINDHSVRFRFRMDNVYLLGYQMEKRRWLEFGHRNQKKELVQLITKHGTDCLGFGCRYEEIERAAHRSTEETSGDHSLAFAINQLAVTKAGRLGHGLIVVIMMISKSARLVPVSDHLAQSFDNRPGTTPLLRAADAYPEERFQLRPNNIRIPPENREIRTIADAIAILVRIDNIDNEDPGELYGTITINNGLYTQYIYNRTRDNYESINACQDVTLTGASESVFAFGNVTKTPSH